MVGLTVGQMDSEVGAWVLGKDIGQFDVWGKTEGKHLEVYGKDFGISGSVV